MNRQNYQIFPFLSNFDCGALLIYFVSYVALCFLSNFVIVSNFATDNLWINWKILVSVVFGTITIQIKEKNWATAARFYLIFGLGLHIIYSISLQRKLRSQLNQSQTKFFFLSNFCRAIFLLIFTHFRSLFTDSRIQRIILHILLNILLIILLIKYIEEYV